MENIKDILKKLISIDKIPSMSATEILDEIATNQYKAENFHLKDPDILCELPVMIQDILVLADFDTEVAMNGILGFLENSTGLYLNETIDALSRIGAYEDMKILVDIRTIMECHGCSTRILRENVNKGYEYQITNFIDTHGEKYDEMVDKIENEANKMYYRCQNRNIFDNLEEYIEKNKNLIVKK